MSAAAVLGLCCLAGALSCPAADPTLENLSGLIEQCAADFQTLEHRFRVPLDETARKLRQQVIANWLARLDAIDFESAGHVDRIDYLLLRSELDYRLEKLKLDGERDRAAALYLPYAQALVDFCKAREDVESIVASDVAQRLDSVAETIERTTKQLEPLGAVPGDRNAVQRRLDGLRASELIASLSRTVQEADRFYVGYDPAYTWWAKAPMQRLNKALEGHRVALRKKIVGVDDSDNQTIIGLPIGAAGLRLAR